MRLGAGSVAHWPACNQAPRPNSYCAFCAKISPWSWRIIYNEKKMAITLSDIFGKPWSVSNLKETGMRIISVKQLFNMREGITAKYDTLPKRLLTETKPN